ncbi:unnamed protein product, partial [Ectocarpus sp. 8 AP-2014]
YRVGSLHHLSLRRADHRLPLLLLASIRPPEARRWTGATPRHRQAVDTASQRLQLLRARPTASYRTMHLCVATGGMFLDWIKRKRGSVGLTEGHRTKSVGKGSQHLQTLVSLRTRLRTMKTRLAARV